ncbi:MAG: DUF1329 domain-containing protein [Thermodesulfobacteriota bacterium]|nr:DUF1329 domain-containing protein [Thermodesulfobacteriota bacterium]
MASQVTIDPGIEITNKNYELYLNDLKSLLTPPDFVYVENGIKNGWITVPVVKKRKYPQPKFWQEATVKYNNASACRVGPTNELIGWTAGCPFPDPKTGAELAWNFRRRNQATDQASFFSDFLLFDKSGRKTGKVERSFKWHLYDRWYMGRRFVPPMPEEPGNNGLVWMKESIIITEPYDIKGFAMIRICYDPIDKPDEVYSYVPAIRRLRRLTGSDVTDPVLGSDAAYDDFEVMRQKIDSKMSFKILDVRDFLVPVHYTEKPPKLFVKGNCFQVEWEIRPLWVLQININNPDYLYKKRIIYIEKEHKTGDVYAGECFDLQGRLWKSCNFVSQAKDPDYFEGNSWYGCVYNDYLSDHSTLMDMYPVFADPKSTAKAFTIKYLLQEAK